MPPVKKKTKNWMTRPSSSCGTQKNSAWTIFSLKTHLISSFISSCQFLLATFLIEFSKDQIRTGLKDICTPQLNLVKHSLFETSVTDLENGDAKKIEIVIFCCYRFLNKSSHMLLNTYCCNSGIFSTWNMIVVLNEALLKHWLSQCGVTRKEKIKMKFLMMSSRRCPCPWQGVGTIWPLRSLSVQPILCFCDFCHCRNQCILLSQWHFHECCAKLMPWWSPLIPAQCLGQELIFLPVV